MEGVGVLLVVQWLIDFCVCFIRFFEGFFNFFLLVIPGLISMYYGAECRGQSGGRQMSTRRRPLRRKQQTLKLQGLPSR